MSHHAFARHLSGPSALVVWLILLALPDLTLAQAQGPIATPPAGARVFTVFLRGTPVGRETMNVRSDATGLTIASQSNLGAPLNIVMRRGEITYRPDLTPASLTLEATINQREVTLRTMFANGSAVSEGNDGGNPVRATNPIQPRTFVYPDIFFGAIEGLGRQLSVINGLPDDIHAFIAPGVDVAVRVKDASRGRVSVGATAIDVYRYELVFSNSTGELVAHLTTEINGGLLIFQVPSQALDVVREDLTSATARTMVFANPTDEPVSMQSNGFTLGGTLTRPPNAAATAKLPAVVLLAGAGADERDGYVGGVPIMGQLAGALADAGFIVIRYDRRGAGQSGGRSESATLGDYAEDARVAVKFLANRKDVDARRIAVLGHSEAAWVAMLAASRDNGIAAVVSIAAPSQTGSELVLDQQVTALSRLNLTPAEREEKIAFQRRIQAAVVGGSSWEGIPADVRRQADTPWFASLLAYDPAQVLEKIRQPLLFVHGQLDKQISVENVERLSETARKASKSKTIDVVSVRGVNHLLVPAVTGDVSEYGTLTDRNVSRDVTMAISDWLTRTLTVRR
ncbi:MAG: alpha/beta fold hydrolase [Vicinamibacterales bacterium]